MLLVGHDGDATMPYLIQQEGNVSGACHCLGPVDGRDSRWVHLVRSRIPVWLMTRLEDADENRRAAEIRTLGVNDKHGRTGRLPRGRRR